MFDRCVCFGLLFTSDDDLGRTLILPYGTFSSADASYLLIPISGLFHGGLKRSIWKSRAGLTKRVSCWYGRLSVQNSTLSVLIYACLSRQILMCRTFFRRILLDYCRTQKRPGRAATQLPRAHWIGTESGTYGDEVFQGSREGRILGECIRVSR